MAGAARLLVASELSRRRPVILFLALVFCGATASLLLLLGSVRGVEAAVGEEIEATLASDWRVAPGRSHELSEGRFFNRSGDAAARLEAAVPGARAAPRIEVQGLFLHTSRYEDFDAGLLIGIDPARDARAADLAARIVAGRAIDAENVWINGTPHPQVLVGEQMLEALGMRIFNGTPEPANFLTLNAGRFTLEGSDVRPVSRTGVVVGAFRTGFGPVDRYNVFVHLDTTRDLLRLRLADDPANVLLVRAPADAAVAPFAAAEGFSATRSEDFLQRYLGAVFSPVRALGALTTVVVLLLAGGWVAHAAAGVLLSDRRRVAVLRALGVPARLVVGPVAAVVLVAGAAGAAAGAIVAWGVAGALRPGLVPVPGMPHLPFSVALSPGLVAGLMAAVLVTAGLAALLAGSALRRIPLTQALGE